MCQRLLGQVPPERADLSTEALQEFTLAMFAWTGLFLVVLYGVNYMLNQKSPSTFIGLEWSGGADWRGW